MVGRGLRPLYPDMIVTTKHALMFALCTALLGLALLLLPLGRPDREWQGYQRAYLAGAAVTDGEQIAIRQITPRLGPDGKPAVSAGPELCLTCHIGLEEISPSHPVETFGCVICHGGLGLALDKELAHTGLRPNPADLGLVEQSCGQAGCHADPGRNHIEQVTRSLQATYAGSISMVRYTFGAQKELAPLFEIGRAHV